MLRPAPGEDLAEPGVVAGDHEVAAEGEVRPRAGGHADHLGDDRLGHGVQRGAALAHLAHPRELVHRDLADLGEVGARAELAAGAGDHHHPDRPGRPRRRGRRRRSSRNIVGFMAFLRSRPVEREGEDAVVGPFDLQRLHRANVVSGRWASTRTGRNGAGRPTTSSSGGGVAACVVVVLLGWALLG